MNYRAITLSETELWREAFGRLPSSEQEPWFTDSWYRLWEQQGYGEAVCFTAEENEKVAVYPFLRNKINTLGYQLDREYSDIQGAPGYNGIATNTEDSHFHSGFRNHFEEWCKENSIVAEFSRCNPVTGNQRYFQPETVFEANRNIIVSLQPADEIRRHYDRSVGTTIRKAIREGLTITCVRGSTAGEETINNFTSIYLSTMERNKAGQEYLYDYYLVARAIVEMQDQIILCFTWLGNKPIAAELVIAGNTTAYSFLGGTLADYYPMRPNHILKDAILHELAEDGLSYFCMGGGIKPDDGIFKYKRSFAVNGEVPFFIAKKIHRPDVYGEIIQQWQSKHPEMAKIYQNRILGYRETNPTNY